MSHRLVKFALVVVFAATSTAVAGTLPAFAGTIIVHPGESIQAAVRHAQPGDTIVVEAGTYYESVLISGKDDLTLRGAGPTDGGTVLMPAAGVTGNNFCARHHSGICILGGPNAPTSGTRITGFKITGFNGFGILAAGTANSTFDHNAAINDGEYGITSFGSTGNRYLHNLAVGNAEAGFYYGDSPRANGYFQDNVSTGNLFGFFLRDSAHGVLRGNHATGNCDGFMFLDTAAPVDAGQWTAVANVSNQNNQFCPPNGEAPAISGVGVAILGADAIHLEFNTVNGNVPSGQADVAGGIVVMSSEPFGGSVPNGNRVVGNTAHHNQPYDVTWDGSGTGNVFRQNDCGTSAPDWICA
jgi:nitrous oxidase accessory protein NosD